MEKEIFLKRKLKNGITVVMEKRNLPVVSLAIANKFGGAYEESKIKGIAHVIEHMVFTGTKTRNNEQISAAIEKKGGILNAFTSNEVTNFWFKLPSEHIFIGLEILSDILNNPIFDEEKFEREKKVILEEIKMYHDDPARDILSEIECNLYTKPFGENVIGNAKSVSALKRDFVAAYFKENYNPENYIVSIVGDGDFDKICEYLENSFKKGKGRPKQLNISKQNKHSVEKRPGIDQAHFVLGFHTPLPKEEDYYALEVLDAYLTGGMSSKLWIKIREDKGLAYAIKGLINCEKDYSYYCIYVGTTKKAIKEVNKIILEELANVDKMGQEDLRKTKELLIGSRKISKEESVNVMNALLYAELNGNAEEYYQHEDKINSVTLEQVKRIAKIKEYSTAMIVPK